MRCPGFSWGSYNFSTLSILSGGTLTQLEGPISLAAHSLVIKAGGTLSIANTTTLAATQVRLHHASGALPSMPATVTALPPLTFLTGDLERPDHVFFLIILCTAQGCLHEGHPMLWHLCRAP